MNLRATFASVAVLGALVLTATAAAPSQAVETFRAGPDVGVHYDAEVQCDSHPHYRVSVTPIMGTTPGWEWGQNVSFRVYVLNSRGVVVGSLRPNNAWSSARIATKRMVQLATGVTYPVTDPFKTFGPYRWNLPIGTYTVQVQYAWQTNRGWSYATNRTSSYYNSRATFAGMTTTIGSTCVVGG